MSDALRTVTLENIKNFAIISDVHLRIPNDDLCSEFLKTLRSLQGIDTLFLLGDIFDFITVSNRYFLEKWAAVFASFAELRQRGIAVYFIEGNHDFGFEHFRNKKLQESFDHCGDIQVAFQHKSLGSVSLRHGDDIICPPSYHAFRGLVKAKIFQKIADALMPARFVDSLFTRYAKISRDQEQYRQLTLDFLHSCLKNFLAKKAPATKIDLLVIGHIHIDLCTQLLQTQIFSGPSWLTAPSYLIFYESGRWERVFTTEKTAEKITSLGLV